MTSGSGKVRAVAKGIRKTTSRFGARLEPFTQVNLMLYRGRGSLDTITQAEIVTPHLHIREDLARFAAAETMVEAVDKVAEEHERNTRLVLLLLQGLRALDAGPGDPAAVAESFLLKLLSLSGFHPAITACAVCGSTDVRLWSSGLGGAVCAGCADIGASAVSPEALGAARGARDRRSGRGRRPRDRSTGARGTRRGGCWSASPSTTSSAGCARSRCS